MTSSERAAYGGNERMRSTPLQRSLAASIGRASPFAVDNANPRASAENLCRDTGPRRRLLEEVRPTATCCENRLVGRTSRAEPYNSSAQSRDALVQLAGTADVRAQAPRNSMQDTWPPIDSRAAHRGPQQAAPEQAGSPTNGSPGSLGTSSSSSAGWLSSPAVPWLHDSWRSLWHNAQTVPEVIVLPNLAPPG